MDQVKTILVNRRLTFEDPTKVRAIFGRHYIGQSLHALAVLAKNQKAKAK